MCVCQHRVPIHRKLVYFWGNTGFGLTKDLLILCKNFIHNVAYLPMSIDLLSVFKIDKIQDQSVSTKYLTVCLYSHQQLAFRESCQLAMITKISYQIAWPMTLPPTYDAIKRETSRKFSIREKPAEFMGTGHHQCKDGLIPSIKHNIYESVEMFSQDFKVEPQVFILTLSILFCCGICDSVSYIISVFIFLVFVKFIILCMSTVTL